MNPDLRSAISGLSDPELVERVKRSGERERHATAYLIAHLAEMQKRKLFRAEGCSSLYKYCTEVLHMAEFSAYRRMKAAKVSLRFPVILELLDRGEVNLTTILLLAPHLTPENHGAVLEEARRKTKLQVQEIVARLKPKPDVSASIRKVPAPRSQRNEPTPPPESELFGQSTIEPGASGSGSSTSSTPGAFMDATPADTAAGAPSPSAKVVPLAPARYKITFTASAETCEMLRRAQDLLCHQFTDRDIAKVLDRALKVLVRELEKKKYAATDHPRSQATGAGAGNSKAGTGSCDSRASQPGAGSDAMGADRSPEVATTPRRSRDIPAAVKRAVWERDRGRCAFVAENGRRCSETGRLELHHVWPHADEGEATLENIQMRCRDHNQYEAEQFFGLWTADRVPEEFEDWPWPEERTQ